MARRGSGLAARFRRAIRSERARGEEEKAARERLEAAAREAREALLSELLQISEVIEYVTAERTEDALRLRFGDRTMDFVPEGDADRVRVIWEGLATGHTHLLYRQPELGEIWVWQYRRGQHEDRLPLFDTGLEELLVRGLDLPRPSDEAPTEERERSL